MVRPQDDFRAEVVLSAEYGIGVNGIYLDSEPTDESLWLPPLEGPDITLGNTDLNVFAYRDQIIQTIHDNPVTIIVAETGAGKSTQVPQFLVDAGGFSRVYLTQPRRAAARNVYERIRHEISDVWGESTGYDITSFRTAGERQGHEGSRIKVVTDGLHLVHELNDKGFQEDEVLIIDEAHEWNTNVEVLVGWTKKAIKENPRLRVVVMSATMDADHLAEYYADVCPSVPPIINIPGRNHHVEKAEVPESTVMDQIIYKILSTPDEDGNLPEGPKGILAFYPGKREIQDGIDELKSRIPVDLSHLVKVFPLHAKLSPSQQQDAIREYPDFISVVLSTDIAQTSMTLAGVRHVIDGGYHRRIVVDEEGTRGLMLSPISIADSAQRAGRAGRVADGTYTLTKLNPSTAHVNMEDRDEYPTPEILRTDIARNMLRLKVLGLDIAEFDMYHKASSHAIEIAKNNLILFGALDAEGDITALGMKMDDYPLSASSARIMVEAEHYHESIRTYLAAITASKEVGGLQYFAQNVGKRWTELTDENASDLLAQLDIFIASQEMKGRDIIEHGLDINNIERAREMFEKVAKIAGVKESTKLEPPSQEERELIVQCLISGYLPNIYSQQGEGETYANAINQSFSLRELSNRSVVRGKPLFVIGDPYNVEMTDGQETKLRKLIENVTVVTARQLGMVASSQVVWKPEGYAIRDGKFKSVERQYLFGVDLGMVQEVPAQPSPRLRQTIIEHALGNPGSAQLEIRRIKDELKNLAHMTHYPIDKISQDQLVAIIEEAAPPDITTPATIEDNLRIMMADPDRGISLDSFVSPEKRQEIIDNAPPEIELEGVNLDLTYKEGVPVVNNYDLASVLNLTCENVTLPDGREVLFSFSLPKRGKRRLRLYELRDRVEAHS